MKDLTLDTTNNALIWEDGDLKLCDGLERIKQHILTALYTLLGDWLLDDSKGIDLPRGMRDEAFLLNDVKKQILGVDGVNQLKGLSLKKDGLIFYITAIVITDNGQIELNEVVRQ